MGRRPMTMAAWSEKLDEFLKLADRELLHHAGTVSHDDAIAKAQLEYDRFAEARAELPAPVDRHFEDAVRDVKQLEKARLTTPKGRGKKPTKP